MFLEFYGAGMMLDGQPTIIGVALDVTQRKESEAVSRRAVMVYESSSRAMVVTDEDTVIVSVNTAFNTIIG